MKIAVPTLSLGRAGAGHSLETKLKAAADAGFEGVEVRPAIPGEHRGETFFFSFH
jgi:sugar phosphate isomerase/epimerase